MKVVSTIAVLALVLTPCAFGQTSTPPSQALPVQAASPQSEKQLDTRKNYLGDDVCASCHREKVESFHHTAHSLTSRLPDQKSILGNFTPEANVLKTSNPDLFFRMDQKGAGFFQTSVEGIAPYTEERTERFAFVIGSGGKGQTYLFWKDDRLFQLPVSYWNQLGWVNSPGYRDGVANFQRPINSRCLECHGTYFESQAPPINRFNQAGFVLGITCEKCHGPGREHAQRESSKSAATSDSAILNPSRFPRDRQIDLCAWCHAGHGEPLSPSFSYIPGESLDKYLDLPKPDPNAPIDVHGDQVELLKKSRCFQSSSMTCLTCHDVHTSQRDPIAFSQRCLSCHKPDTAAFPKADHLATSNCISCHMPMQETNLIVFNWKGTKVKPQVRNHWIKIYPELSQSR
jgi:Cytochrome c554 and c-prime